MLRNEFGMMIETPYGIDALTDADVIVIPFWRSPSERPPEELLEALRRAHARGARIVGLCLGTYVLAYAGLLDRRRASTHWEVVEDFRARFPNVLLEESALYVEAGTLVTSAGTGAGIDCCLNIVRGIYGNEIANRISQRLVIPHFRDGSLAQLIKTPSSSNGHSVRIERTIAYVKEHIGDQHDVGSLAFRTGMSRRSFTRHFFKVTGMSLGNWLLVQRLKRAQLLLESGNDQIEAIAEMVGFTSAAAFRRHFRSECGITPSEWRRMHALTPICRSCVTPYAASLVTTPRIRRASRQMFVSSRLRCRFTRRTDPLPKITICSFGSTLVGFRSK
jgi:transcriptional regulator GlxA family with amidase domain